MSTWEERMGAKAKTKRDARQAAEFEALTADRRTAEPWRYDPTPPDDGTCRECYEWRPFPPGQEHFGYAWWNICSTFPTYCKFEHDHHDGEVWMAAI